MADRGREMLVGNADLGGLPEFADAVHRGRDNIVEHRDGRHLRDRLAHDATGAVEIPLAQGPCQRDVQAL